MLLVNVRKELNEKIHKNVIVEHWNHRKFQTIENVDFNKENVFRLFTNLPGKNCLNGNTVAVLALCI